MMAQGEEQLGPGADPQMGLQLVFRKMNVCLAAKHISDGFFSLPCMSKLTLPEESPV